ncbi:hypothetical protein ACH5RR_034767 [Cinchona calisaya]|uniref:HECT-type E3 ubiquitin transferase n=1 Tax=Cinchona calisaya TaxID=153742 RepID=A0ABD2YDY8_9GENT
MCEKLHPAEPVKADEKQMAFVKFSDKHRKFMNAFIHQNPCLLEKSFSLLLKNDINDILDLIFSTDADEEKLIIYEWTEVPLKGFSALQGISRSQKFQIHKAYGSPDHLPSARTCFNQLDLPEYPSKQHLVERLPLAIHEANEGFGFGLRDDY